MAKKSSKAPTKLRCNTPPASAEDPMRHDMVPGLADPVGLQYFAQPCPRCAKETSQGGVFLNYAKEQIEFWRCGACGSYGFANHGRGPEAAR